MEINLKEAVKLLRIPEATITRWVRQGYIPSAYRNGSYTFNSERLKSWAKLKQIHINEIKYQKSALSSSQQTDLISALSLGGCYYQVKGATKEELFGEIELLLALSSDSGESLSSQLTQREKLAATGIGKGFAIPHPQYPKDWGLGGPAVGIFFLENPLEYQALDQIPVSVIFALLSPSPKIHLKLLSQLAQVLRSDNMSDFFKHKPSFEDVIKQFKKILEKNTP